MCKYDDGDDDRWVDGWMDAMDRTIGSRGRGCFRGRDWRIERGPMDGILGGGSHRSRRVFGRADDRGCGFFMCGVYIVVWVSM